MKIISIFSIVLVCYLALVQGETDCEKHRDRELKTGKRFPKAALLIPVCELNGDYAPLQCHGKETEKKRACQCWSKNGDILTAPSFKLRNCVCILAKKEAEKTKSDKITCADDGRFERKQCTNDGNCQCVNQDTGIKEAGKC